MNSQIVDLDRNWEMTWIILENGSLEIRSPDRTFSPFTRDGERWIGENAFGKEVNLTPGAW